VQSPGLGITSPARSRALSTFFKLFQTHVLLHCSVTCQTYLYASCPESSLWGAWILCSESYTLQFSAGSVVLLDGLIKWELRQCRGGLQVTT
jgi:hypothetical protein